MVKSQVRLLWFLIAALIPIAALMAANYLAIGEITPAYDKFGGPWYEYDGKPLAQANMSQTRRASTLSMSRKKSMPFTCYRASRVVQPDADLAARLARHAVRMTSPELRRLNFMTFLITAVVIAFYVWRTNNYGGWTCGPRWQFWLTPLFLLALLPVADFLGRSRAGRGWGYLFLGMSVFSTVYPVWNPVAPSVDISTVRVYGVGELLKTVRSRRADRSYRT